MQPGGYGSIVMVDLALSGLGVSFHMSLYSLSRTIHVRRGPFSGVPGVPMYLNTVLVIFYHLMRSILLVLSGNSGTTYMYFKTRHILHAIHQMD